MPKPCLSLPPVILNTYPLNSWNGQSKGRAREKLVPRRTAQGKRIMVARDQAALAAPRARVGPVSSSRPRHRPPPPPRQDGPGTYLAKSLAVNLGRDALVVEVATADEKRPGMA